MNCIVFDIITGTWITCALHVYFIYVHCISRAEGFPSECHLRGCSNKWRNSSRIKVHNLVIQGVVGIYPPSHFFLLEGFEAILHSKMDSEALQNPWAGWAAEPQVSAFICGVPDVAESRGQLMKWWELTFSYIYNTYIYIYMFIYIYIYIYTYMCSCVQICVYTVYEFVNAIVIEIL